MIIDRAKKPLPKSKIDFNVPKISHGIVDDFEYYHVENNKLPIINLIISQNFGYRLDTEGKRGLTYLSARMLQKGAGKYNSLELNERFQYLGLNIYSTFHEDDFAFIIQSLTENFEEAFSLFSDVLYNPHLAEKDFLTEHKNLISSLQHSQKEPGNILFNVVNKIFGAGSSIEYPVQGYLDDVKNISIEDIKLYYEKIISKSKIKLFFTGNISKDEIENLIKKYLVKRQGVIYKPETVFNNQPLGKRLYYVNMPGKPQTVIGTAQKIEHHKLIDVYGLEIALNILGGNFTSRLNSNLREEKGFTYGISAYRRHHFDIGFINITTSVDSNNSITSVKEIYNEVHKLCENITEEEVRFTKDHLINTYPMIFTTLQGINVECRSNVLLGYPLDNWEVYREKINNTDIEAVKKAIKDNINFNNMSTVLIGDKTNFEIDNNDFFETVTELDYNGNKI
ncbi:MAG TPA: pitrilysin family protein [Melioribacteraceae bacterium]|nr:pitrilysin family protein [Melioribacteraceae bacterium]